MERTARASFRVLRINRWMLAVALLAGLGLLLLPARELLPVTAPAPERVPVGVTMQGRPLGGQTAGELYALLTELARDMSRLPLEGQVVERDAALFYRQPAAAEEPIIEVWVPPLNGFRLDVAQTAALALSASPGEAILPVWSQIPAAGAATAAPDLPMYQVHPGKQAVALIINVAWGDEYLPDMLATLSEHKVKATFFIVGRWAEHHPDMVRRIAAAGHEIANHGYNDTKSPAQMAKSGEIKADIDRADQVLRQILNGVRPKYYSPHMGEVNATIVRAARALGYTTVLWSLDTIDWKPDATESSVRARVLSKVKDGDLILMHPTKATRAALPAILKGLQDRSLQARTLSDLLSPGTPLPGQR